MAVCFEVEGAHWYIITLGIGGIYWYVFVSAIPEFSISLWAEQALLNSRRNICVVLPMPAIRPTRILRTIVLNYSAIIFDCMHATVQLHLVWTVEQMY